MQWLARKFGSSKDLPTTTDIEDLQECRTCDDPCDAHPHYPEALASKIDQTSAMRGSVKLYSVHILICSGHTNWPEKVEKERGSIVRAINQFADQHPEFRIMASVCDAPSASFATNPVAAARPAKASSAQAPAMDLLIFPAGVRVFDVTAQTVAAALLQFLPGSIVEPAEAPEEKEKEKEKDKDKDKEKEESDADDAPPALTEEELKATTLRSEKLHPNHRHVLICSHKLRDKRCGVTGPILRKQFEDSLQRLGVSEQVSIYEVSHIGGHKFAGNVIVYPPGDWYGRVTPCDVDPLIQVSLNRGEVINVLFRGRMYNDFWRTPKNRIPPFLPEAQQQQQQ